ncbi:GNAT family N-acetyltransferase [Promicromonospora thailandica]|uniref:Ribosomal protein S18 acetylase RimI n=1 Tax=Promicromonospora thailandica TaxID=765201 RepID=A0A9X2FYU5_9MICO|nr:GNAT family N-acetyltransferase [Promicromonospora thailandica]MCP2263030.1 Ribosomal protein S18 acetylase RimI [Promicromonospora thailandica]BFF18399.1 GNAT family N-acetyltransferase [Promicromonospora thailandica]
MTVRALGIPEVLRRADELARIYQRAFGYSDERRDHFRDARLAYLPLYDGALALGAFEGDDLVGFVYGFEYQPGHWWPQQVGPALADAGHTRWTQDAFELNELEVLPEHQGRGHGTALLRELLGQVPHRHTLLSTTADPADRAKVLYRRMGFVDLLPGFRYAGVTEPATIMGRQRVQV